MSKKISKKTAVNPVVVAMEKGFATVHEELKKIRRKQVDHDVNIAMLGVDIREIRGQLKNQHDTLCDHIIEIGEIKEYMKTELPTRAVLNNYAGAVDRCFADVTKVDQMNLMHGDRIGRLETDSEKHEKDIGFLKSKVAA